MLTITVPESEFYDWKKEEFVTLPSFSVDLEHSLVSISKWEAIWEKPFLSKIEKSTEEILSYVECMEISPGGLSGKLNQLSEENFRQINEYINRKYTATTFGEMPQRPGRGEAITAELIYYWMVAFNVPFDCESWHLNRLFALIRICNIKNSKQKPMSRSEIARRNAELNARRKAELGTRG